MTSLAAGNDLFAAALTATMRASVALERNTAHPWVITAEYLPPDCEGTHRLILIVQAPLSRRPESYDHLPDGSTLLREDSFPCERFAQMALEVRPRYRAQYEIFLLWRWARLLGKTPDRMVPHRDYDPVMLDADAQLWLRPGSNPLGD